MRDMAFFAALSIVMFTLALGVLYWDFRARRRSR